MLRRLVPSLFFLAVFANAKVVGTATPAPPLTVARIAALPKAQQQPWLDYLKASEQQMEADKAALAAERRGLAVVPDLPHEGHSAMSMPLNRDSAWYGTPEARHIADVIVSYQIANGGWSKNIDMAGPQRERGQAYAPQNAAPVGTQKLSGANDNDAPRDVKWHYIGTLDNDATTTEIRFLARVQAAIAAKDGEAYRAAVLRGIRYLLRSQYPNGGWPQVWPLEGGYHDAITYNDDVLTDVSETLTMAATPDDDFRFVPAELRRQSKIAIQRALGCILATQVVLNGKKTIWAQQHDMLTLAPVAARNFEPAALSTGESAHLLEFLMALPKPSAEVVQAVDAGAAWFRAHEIHDIAVVGGRNTPEGRHVVEQKGAGPLWARYYSLETQQPVFGDRDKSVHDTMREISAERRNGYGWYGDSGVKMLAEYERWKHTLFPPSF